MKVSVIIPTKNEEGNIGKVLKEVPKRIVDEIIVVDGHSTDKTQAEAKANLRPKKDRLVLQKGRGFGGAFRQGLEEVSGNIIVLMDGDGSQDPKDIPALLKKIKLGYEFVLASRYASGGRSEDDTLIRWLGNRALTFLTNFIHATNVTDSLYLFAAISKKGLAKLNLKSSSFEFCTEILVKAHRAGLKFAEVPVVERRRFSGKSKVYAFWHGLKILDMIVRRYRE